MQITLKQSSGLIQEWGIAPMLYTILVSDTYNTNTKRVLSSYTETTLKKVFKDISIHEIRAGLKKLEDLHVIELSGLHIQVGENCELFANAEYDAEPFKYKKELVAKLKAMTKKRMRGVDTEQIFKRAYAIIESDKLNTADFLSFYKYTYFALVEEMPTTFAEKEKGQMGHMVKFYGTGHTLKNIIFEYISNHDMYSKDFISIGGMLYARHKITKGLNKTKTLMTDNGDTSKF